MSSLYTVSDVARYLRKPARDVVQLIDLDGLPAVNLPGDRRNVRKIPLHGLHRWLSARAVGSEFITVQELAAEMAACVEAPATSPVQRAVAQPFNPIFP
jgi:hypothetical protein